MPCSRSPQAPKWSPRAKSGCPLTRLSPARRRRSGPRSTPPTQHPERQVRMGQGSAAKYPRGRGHREAHDPSENRALSVSLPDSRTVGVGTPRSTPASHIWASKVARSSSTHKTAERQQPAGPRRLGVAKCQDERLPSKNRDSPSSGDSPNLAAPFILTLIWFGYAGLFASNADPSDWRGDAQFVVATLGCAALWGTFLPCRQATRPTLHRLPCSVRGARHDVGGALCRPS